MRKKGIVFMLVLALAIMAFTPMAMASDGVGNPAKGTIISGAICNGIENHLISDIEYTTLNEEVSVLLRASDMADFQAILTSAERVQAKDGEVYLKIEPTIGDFKGFFANYDPCGAYVVGAKLEISNQPVFIAEDTCWKNADGQYQPKLVWVPFSGDCKYILVANLDNNEYFQIIRNGNNSIINPVAKVIQ